MLISIPDQTENHLFVAYINTIAYYSYVDMENRIENIKPFPWYVRFEWK